jgi:hypothetical protein
MAQTLVVLILGVGSCTVAARAQGEPVEDWCNYRIPPGFVYEGESLTLEQAREFPAWRAVQTLLNVKEITPEVAAAIVRPCPDEDAFLTLPALQTIDVATADALSGHCGYLQLWGITTLTQGVADALSKRRGTGLNLIGVRDLTPEVARALAVGKRRKLFLGLTSLSTEIAKILAEFKGDLAFPRLETLSLDTAKAIAEHGEAVRRGSETFGPYLDLGKARLTPAAAEALLTHDGPLGLNRLKELEPGVGDILAKHRFEVGLVLEKIDSVALARKLFSESGRSSSVARLRTMSPEIAAEYARHYPPPGYLERLDTLSAEAARELAKGNLEIKLPAVTKLSPELATALTNRTRSVYLRGIKALDGSDAVAVAEALASTPAPIWMTSLERVSASALAALRKKDTIRLPPEEELTIVP